MGLIPQIAKTHRNSSGTVKAIQSTFQREKDGINTLTPDLSNRGAQDIDMALGAYFDAQVKSGVGHPAAAQWRQLQTKANNLKIRVPVGASPLIQAKAKNYTDEILKLQNEVRESIPSATTMSDASEREVTGAPATVTRMQDIRIAPLSVRHVLPENEAPAQSFAAQAAAENAEAKTIYSLR